MQELTAVTTPWNTGANRNPHRVSSNGIDGSTPDASVGVTIDVDPHTKFISEMEALKI